MLKTPNKTYDNIYGIVISDILINLSSCHGFSTYNKANTTLSCRIFLVSYYISKGFLVVEPNIN